MSYLATTGKSLIAADRRYITGHIHMAVYSKIRSLHFSNILFWGAVSSHFAGAETISRSTPVDFCQERWLDNKPKVYICLNGSLNMTKHWLVGILKLSTSELSVGRWGTAEALF